MATPGLIAIHPGAGGGLAAKRWAAAAAQILDATGAKALELPTEAAMVAAWRTAAEAGAKVLAAGGGDGSLNLLLQTLMDPTTDRPRWPICIASVALGSSNDAHKPYPSPQSEAWVAGRPVALNLATAKAVDLIRADWLDEQGQEHCRYALLNASIGVLAEGNAFYSARCPQRRIGQSLTTWAKNCHPEAGMSMAALVALASHQALPLKVVGDGHCLRDAPTHHFNLLLSQHVSGSFRYDLPELPRPGLAWAAMAYGGHRLGLLKLAFHLAQGRFLGQAGVWTAQVESLEVLSPQPFWLELDGELCKAQAVRFRILPQVLSRCGAGLSRWA